MFCFLKQLIVGTLNRESEITFFPEVTVIITGILETEEIGKYLSKFVDL